MKVSGIFKTLIIVVICIIIGATAINIFLPNVVAQMSNAIENTLYQATGLSFDFNGDGSKGNNKSDVSANTGKKKTTTVTDKSTVDGFSKASK